MESDDSMSFLCFYLHNTKKQSVCDRNAIGNVQFKWNSIMDEVFYRNGGLRLFLDDMTVML